MTDNNSDETDDEQDRLLYSTKTITGTMEFGSRSTDLTIRTDDGEMTMRGVTVETEEQHRERLSQMRDDAPDPEYLTESGTTDIDELIEALQAAKERGVDTVYVNDDGRTMATRPCLTNNLVGRSTMAPPPEELNEYVEL